MNFKIHALYFEKSVDDFEIAHKNMLVLSLEYSKYPLQRVFFFKIFMRWHDGLNIDHAYLNIHEVTLWVFWIFKRCRHGLFWISMKLSHGYFEYSWSDVIGILNVQKLTSSEYSKADVKWIFRSWRRCNMKWPNGYFEYSKADVMDILNIYEVMSLVFWIRSDVMELFRSWRHGYLNNLSGIGIFNIHSKLRRFLNIHSNDVTLRIFKIPMSLWIFKIPMASALNIPMTAIREYSKYPWHEYSQCLWC